MTGYLFSAVAPEVTVSPQDTNVTSFEELTLTCGGMGFPIPTITWFQNGSAIDQDLENTTIYTTVSTSSMNISSTLTIAMAMVNDSGTYHCNLSSLNYLDAMTEEALVLVQSK